MNNQKTVKSANGEKSVVLYIVTCALVVIQPLLDILSSIVINLGKANYISVSGAIRAVIIAAVTVFTLGFYKGKYSTLFKVYNGIAAAYIALMCLMSAPAETMLRFSICSDSWRILSSSRSCSCSYSRPRRPSDAEFTPPL